MINILLILQIQKSFNTIAIKYFIYLIIYCKHAIIPLKIFNLFYYNVILSFNSLVIIIFLLLQYLLFFILFFYFFSYIFFYIQLINFLLLKNIKINIINMQ
ncbi:hypothetical protein PPERSA_02808 [Pseudocohnilembus persalinus]|uniref:Transmembrane protein n=1 Tax=Pseudocohnilembus persalinus TaxID=266149 RepID=A0A0V0QNA3_PSEPJ|nr:hypothetical protein PPERSA_02808 [Pseudocohnilembus persalinus]|eukprot:KRX03429.1 hypothetical protein PPERSA_02808 [Pseudocohnilembus persalinus]